MTKLRCAAKLIGGGLILATLVSCATVGRSAVAQLLTDPPLFMVVYPVKFTPANSAAHIKVPEGFVTDLASIPRVLWWWQSPHEATLGPAILHDFLYWQQTCTKDEADAILYVAMRNVGVSAFDAWGIYTGVRTELSKRAWQDNERARKAGEIRFFTPNYVKVLLDSDLKPGDTLKKIQLEATDRGGSWRPPVHDPALKAACIAGMQEYQKMRSI